MIIKILASLAVAAAILPIAASAAEPTHRPPALIGSSCDVFTCSSKPSGPTGSNGVARTGIAWAKDSQSAAHRSLAPLRSVVRTSGIWICDEFMCGTNGTHRTGVSWAVRPTH